MDTQIDTYDWVLEDDARKTMAHRLAEGKGIVQIEQRNEAAEKVLTEQLTERAKSGEHFPSSLDHV